MYYAETDRKRTQALLKVASSTELLLLWLKYVEQHTMQELADFFHTSPSSISSRILIAKKKIIKEAQRMEDYQRELPVVLVADLVKSV